MPPRRIDHRHPGIQPAVPNLLPHHLFGFSKLSARIHAKPFVGIVEQHSGHTPSGMFREMDDIRQVIFPLGVAGVEFLQGAKEKLAVDDIGARVDFTNRLHLCISVTILDDARDTPLG